MEYLRRIFGFFGFAMRVEYQDLHGRVECVQVNDVGLAVTGNKVEATGDAHSLFIEINGEDFFADVVVAALRLLLQGEQVAIGETSAALAGLCWFFGWT